MKQAQFKIPTVQMDPLDPPYQLQSHTMLMGRQILQEMPALGESVSIFTTSLQPWHGNAPPHTAVLFIG